MTIFQLVIGMAKINAVEGVLSNKSLSKLTCSTKWVALRFSFCPLWVISMAEMMRASEGEIFCRLVLLTSVLAVKSNLPPSIFCACLMMLSLMLSKLLAMGAKSGFFLAKLLTSIISPCGLVAVTCLTWASLGKVKKLLFISTKNT